MNGSWDESVDFLIIGSGGGSIPAALVTKELGKRALIVEKTDKFGGSTAMSGGVLWIPNNALMKREGIPDSYERAWTYFNAAVTATGPATSPARRKAYLSTGPQMVEYLEAKGMKWWRPEGWSDYYDDLPGGEPRSRSLQGQLFNLNELGEWTPRLRQYPGMSMPVNSGEFPELMLYKRTWAGKKMVAKYLYRSIRDKLTGSITRGSGSAIQGRLLQIGLREGLQIWLESPVVDLITEAGRVVGAVIEKSGRKISVRVNDGVLINAGGFSRNGEMRRKYQPAPTAEKWTSANPGDTGEMLEVAMKLGAATDFMDEAWWIVTSLCPDGAFPKGATTETGYPIPFMHHMDLGKPYGFLVNAKGVRFANESSSYMEVGQKLYRAGGVPSWYIMESRHRNNYFWGTAPPGKPPKEWLESGYMKCAGTLRELAAICGIDYVGLSHTTERFNRFAKTGVDEDFNRGARKFDHHAGDPTVKPNPCIGGMEQGPFYAVAIYPGDVGTCGGLVTDEHACVLKADGTAIPGLYATGNSTASVVGRCYPAAGASIGASFIFAYRAAHHAAGKPL